MSKQKVRIQLIHGTSSDWEEGGIYHDLKLQAGEMALNTTTGEVKFGYVANCTWDTAIRVNKTYWDSIKNGTIDVPIEEINNRLTTIEGQIVNLQNTKLDKTSTIENALIEELFTEEEVKENN